MLQNLPLPAITIHEIRHVLLVPNILLNCLGGFLIVAHIVWYVADYKLRGFEDVGGEEVEGGSWISVIFENVCGGIECEGVPFMAEIAVGVWAGVLAYWATSMEDFENVNSAVPCEKGEGAGMEVVGYAFDFIDEGINGEDLE
jgi:hypothetical protein